MRPVRPKSPDIADPQRHSKRGRSVRNGVRAADRDDETLCGRTTDKSEVCDDFAKHAAQIRKAARARAAKIGVRALAREIGIGQPSLTIILMGPTKRELTLARIEKKLRAQSGR